MYEKRQKRWQRQRHRLIRASIFQYMDGQNQSGCEVNSTTKAGQSLWEVFLGVTWVANLVQCQRTAKSPWNKLSLNCPLCVRVKKRMDFMWFPVFIVFLQFYKKNMNSENKIYLLKSLETSRVLQTGSWDEVFSLPKLVLRSKS